MTANGTEKLRVLCLHGYHQNGAMIREKTGSMRKLLKKYAEFEYIDGPHESNIVNPGVRLRCLFLRNVSRTAMLETALAGGGFQGRSRSSRPKT